MHQVQIAAVAERCYPGPDTCGGEFGAQCDQGFEGEQAVVQIGQTGSPAEASARGELAGDEADYQRGFL